MSQLSRRQFIKNTLAASTAAAAAGISQSAHAFQPLQLTHKWQFQSHLPELFEAPPRMENHYPVVVIGSGFGGAISAYRLGKAGIKTAVIERGNRWPTDPYRYIFPHEFFPDGRMFWHRETAVFFPAAFLSQEIADKQVIKFGGVMEVIDRYVDGTNHSNVFQASAVGGGSVVYTGAKVIPRRENWNKLYNLGIDYDEMVNVYYPRVKNILGQSKMPWDVLWHPTFKHCRDWDRQFEKAGYQPYQIDGNWDWDIVRGEFYGQSSPSASLGTGNFGNSNGCKNDLTKNYIPMAEATGNVSVHHNHEMKNVRFDGSVYRLDLVEYDPFGEVIESKTITCDKLILSAGSYNTTRMLVRAKARGDLPQLNEFVGRNWGDNGLRYCMRQSRFFWPNGTQGICSPSGVYVPDSNGMSVNLENWSAFTPVEIGASASLAVTVDTENRGYFRYRADIDDAVLEYDPSKEVASTEAARAVNNRVARANWQKTGASAAGILTLDDVRFNGSHPVGGCEIGYATDLYGRVKGYKGLYINDGALLPGSVGGANPSFTISAFAERNIENIIANDFV